MLLLLLLAIMAYVRRPLTDVRTYRRYSPKKMLPVRGEIHTNPPLHKPTFLEPHLPQASSVP